MTDVDLIVLDLDGGEMLAECIASLRDQTMKAARIIVFDNGSRIPVSQRLEGADLTIVRSETNLGFAGGVNAALVHSSAPYVGVINNDVVLQPNWIAAVHDALERHDRLAAVQTIIRRPDGRIDGAGISVSDGTFRQIGHGKPVGSPLEVAWGVSATAALYRRAALGPSMFDASLFAYYEDVELSARLRRDGWCLSVLPMVLATHRGSGTASRLGGDALRLRTRNRYLVARAHRGSGSMPALLWEDLKLAFSGRTSLKGIVQGMLGKR